MQLEVSELLRADEVVAGSGVDEQAIAHDPAVLHGGRPRLPANQVFAVKKLDRFFPGGRLGWRERGGASGGPRDLVAALIDRFALEQAVPQASFETLVVLALFPLRRHAKANLAIGKFDARDGPGAAKAPDKGADQRPPAGESDLQPGRIFFRPRLKGHVPAPNDRLILGPGPPLGVHGRGQGDGNK